MPATIVNWGGTPASIEDWCGLMAELTGLEPRFEETPNTIGSVHVDLTRLHELAGEPTVSLERRDPADGRRHGIPSSSAERA